MGRSSTKNKAAFPVRIYQNHAHIKTRNAAIKHNAKTSQFSPMKEILGTDTTAVNNVSITE